MRIGVTSASGQLGSAIIEKAVIAYGDFNVVGLARNPEKAKHLGIEIRTGDYNNQSDFEENLKDVDVLIIISGNDVPDKRIDQHRNIINGAKKAEVKKLIYTSIFGDESQSHFDDIIQSNRQTEKDIAESGLDYIIGRNGLYIEADFEALDDYQEAGEVVNSAGAGKCGYTCREELALAYVNMVRDDKLNGGVYNLCGEPITQQELVAELNRQLDLDLKYRAVSTEEYLKDRIAAYGDFFGSIIGGVYEGIYQGALDVKSDFLKVTGRNHRTLKQMVEIFAQAEHA